jgi:hypothetical protein
MTENRPAKLARRYCYCGNPARPGHPTCGIVLCMANDAYEQGLAEGNDLLARRAQLQRAAE